MSIVNELNIGLKLFLTISWFLMMSKINLLLIFKLIKSEFDR